MTKIIITDDHAVVRKGIKLILSEIKKYDTIEEASTGKELLEKINKSDFDLLILDVSLPDMHGIELFNMIKKTKPKMPVLILSMFPEEQYGKFFLDAGVQGYLTKGNNPDELLVAIKRILSGKKYISPTLAEFLLFPMNTQNKPINKLLSKREFEILIMIVNGKKIKDIAFTLDISPKTIDTYKRRILEKLGLKDTASLISFAIHNKLISDQPKIKETPE